MNSQTSTREEFVNILTDGRGESFFKTVFEIKDISTHKNDTAVLIALESSTFLTRASTHIHVQRNGMAWEFVGLNEVNRTKTSVHTCFKDELQNVFGNLVGVCGYVH